MMSLLAALLSPELKKGGPVATHDNPRVRAAEEQAALDRLAKFHCILLHLQYPNILSP